ncbi:hypothetical protein VTJ83DRAFT_5627 [Remersonia thermophila]|uniref:Tryptophan synthase beta chain-like PALP domain-containing protein n=1 Tax=Remersonia thermophila TaxID=72144 RepID=A0ABR4D7C7_9PEZI
MVTVELPEPLASIPREVLTFGPSPIQHLRRISEALGGKVHVYAKREDCNSGLAFGGNKIRKLEYLLPDALSQGCDTLVTVGGVQSNHTRAVAAAAAARGLKVATLQERWVDWSDPGYSLVGNIQLSRLMGADVNVSGGGGGHEVDFGIGHKRALARLAEHLRAQGARPYSIPAGASDHPLGGLGFARWAFEVEAQEREMGVFFETVVACAVTGSTLAGMVAGFKLAEKLGARKRRVVGIDASAKARETREQALRIARQTAERIGLREEDIADEDVVLDDRYHAGQYGIPDDRTLEAIRFGARTEAFITDPVYEGKSLAGLMDMVRNGEIPEGSNVLYAHLGGQLALNAYSAIQ